MRQGSAFPPATAVQQHDEESVMRPKTRTKLKRKPVNGTLPHDGQEFRIHDGVNIVVRACFRNHFAGAISNLEHRFSDGYDDERPRPQRQRGA